MRNICQRDHSGPNYDVFGWINTKDFSDVVLDSGVSLCRMQSVDDTNLSELGQT